MGQVIAYCAVSLDGFIAGPGGELGWLETAGEGSVEEPGTLGFEALLARVGALLMGRSTFEAVRGFGAAAWPYGERPVLVATRRPLAVDGPRDVRACAGDIAALCEAAREAAGAGDVYVDGGSLVTQALEAGLLDALVVTVAPVMLGEGIRLYQGRSTQGLRAEVLGMYRGMPQLRLTPRREERPAAAGLGEAGA